MKKIASFCYPLDQEKEFISKEANPHEPKANFFRINIYKDLNKEKEYA